MEQRRRTLARNEVDAGRPTKTWACPKPHQSHNALHNAPPSNTTEIEPTYHKPSMLLTAPHRQPTGGNTESTPPHNSPQKTNADLWAATQKKPSRHRAPFIKDSTVSPQGELDSTAHIPRVTCWTCKVPKPNHRLQTRECGETDPLPVDKTTENKAYRL